MKELKLLPTTLVVTLYLLLFNSTSFAQNVGINETGAAPDGSALLDLNATDKGFLITRADTLNINSPAFGLLTLSPVDSCFYLFNGINWTGMGGAGDNCICGVPIGVGIPLDCGLPFTDSRDNEVYGTVEIGNQCWMSENLNYTPSSGSSWCYDNAPSKCDLYGRLYIWNTASNTTSSSANPSGVQGVCPTEWHLPSDREWQELEIFLGISAADINDPGWRGTNEGDALKAISLGGNNSTGFTALPGGIQNGGMFFYGITGGYWWSSTEDGNKAWRRYLSGAQSEIERNAFGKHYGYSVRCVRD